MKNRTVPYLTNNIDPEGSLTIVQPSPINWPQPKGEDDSQRHNKSKGRGKWKCTAKCPVLKIHPNACCPKYTYGAGYGSSPGEACSQAEYIARNETPCGCRTRHCSRKAFKTN
jgi:hypothetical protein